MNKKVDLKVVENNVSNIESSNPEATDTDKTVIDIPQSLRIDFRSQKSQSGAIPSGIDAVRPLTISEAQEFNTKINDCIEYLFQEGIHYGIVKGIDKKFLFKAGAEVVIKFLGLVPRVEIIDKVEDYKNGFFSYTCKTWLVDGSGVVCAEGLAAANSKENKYMKSNPYNIQNILIKMSKKRSLVDATLGVATLSNRFSQDEDLVDTDFSNENTNIDKPNHTVPSGTDSRATEKQIKYLEDIMRQNFITVEDMNRYVKRYYNVEDYNNLTKAQASNLIQKY